MAIPEDTKAHSRRQQSVQKEKSAHKKKEALEQNIRNKTYQNEITLKSYLHLYSLRLHCCNVGDSICGAHRRYNLKVLLVSMMRTN